ncbi:hypothetical protein C8R44DRAFT_810418, partial [Mycena epipterygia]
AENKHEKTTKRKEGRESRDGEEWGRGIVNDCAWTHGGAKMGMEMGRGPRDGEGRKEGRRSEQRWAIRGDDDTGIAKDGNGDVCMEK